MLYVKQSALNNQHQNYVAMRTLCGLLHKAT